MHKWKFNKVQWNTYTICCNIVGFYNLIIILVPDLPMRAVLYSLLLAPQICPFVLLLPASQPITGTESLINTPLLLVLSPLLFFFLWPYHLLLYLWFFFLYFNLLWGKHPVFYSAVLCIYSPQYIVYALAWIPLMYDLKWRAFETNEEKSTVHILHNLTVSSCHT